MTLRIKQAVFATVALNFNMQVTSVNSRLADLRTLFRQDGPSSWTLNRHFSYANMWTWAAYVNMLTSVTSPFIFKTEFNTCVTFLKSVYSMRAPDLSASSVMRSLLPSEQFKPKGAPVLRYFAILQLALAQLLLQAMHPTA